MIMQVHDELVFEIEQSKIEQYIPELTKLMESAARTEMFL